MYVCIAYIVLTELEVGVHISAMWVQHFDLLFVYYSFGLLFLLPWRSCACEDMPMRLPRSNVIADATYIGRACGQHCARVYCPSLHELDEIDTWFDSEPGGGSDDFVDANTRRLRAGGDMVDPSVGVISTLKRTLKRARVRCPRALKRVKRNVSIEERTVHFLTTVPATASLFHVHEYSVKRFKRSALSLGQMSAILQAEIGPGFAKCDSDKTDVGDCRRPRVLNPVVSVVKDEYGKGFVCPSDRSRAHEEKGGNCVKEEHDESNALSFSGSVVGVPGEIDEVACARPKVGRVVPLQCGSAGGSLGLGESNSDDLSLCSQRCSRQGGYVRKSFERVCRWLSKNKRKPVRGSSHEENSIAQTWNILLRRLQNGYSIPAIIAEGIRGFQKQLKEDPVWIANAMASSSVGKRSRIVASSSRVDACTQRSKGRRHSRLSPRISPSSRAYCNRKQQTQQQPPRPQSQLPLRPSQPQQCQPCQPEQQQLSHQLSHHQ